MHDRNILRYAERIHGQHRSRAFTLVELLVVISIIALLLSVLMPALNRARESAKTVVCKSNMKQIGYACLVYAEFNKGCMPPSWLSLDGNPTTNNFLPILSKVLGEGQKTTHGDFYDKKKAGNKIWMCPSFKDLADHAKNPTCIYSYAMNLHLSFKFDYSKLSTCYNSINTTRFQQNYWAPLVKIGEIKRPSEKVLVSDAAGWHVEFNFNSFNLVISDPALRHNKKINVLLSDMSVSQDARSKVGIGGFKTYKNIFTGEMPDWYRK